MRLKILNKKEIKKILSKIEEQFGAKIKLQTLLQNKDGRVYMVNRDFGTIDESKLRLDSIGLYIGTMTPEGFRPSIEGSQLIGPYAKSNVIDTDNVKDWMSGEQIITKYNNKGFLIIKNNNDCLGAGKIQGDRILNYVPKSRRIGSKTL